MSTYSPIASQTLTSTASSITFSGIPQTYTDLVIVANVGASTSSYDFAIRFNSDTGSNYSVTRLRGNGSTASSTRASNTTFINTQSIPSSINGAYIISVNNYSNTATYKTALIRANNPSAVVEAAVGLWRSTSAITSITISPEFIDTFLSGCTFNLYGVASGSPKAFGGNTVSTDGTYWYHTFTSSGVFTPATSLTADYLVVAGGGGGGGGRGGGGGAGGLRSTVGTTGGGGSLESALSLTAQDYTITIGAGGAGGGRNYPQSGGKGSNSVFSTITSTGGGSGTADQGSNNGNENGGSGGGGTNSAASNGGTGTANQGYAGATFTVETSGNNQAGGGGGAGQAGTTNSSQGGNGVSISALATVTGTGVSNYYAGGGSGAYGGGTTLSGGLGGGGTGGTGTTATAATANTGGGGGGASGGDGNNGKNGGSGIVIVRYAV